MDYLKLPNYRIERELGKGGMATVYLALQTLLNRLVALKVMSPELAVGKNFQSAFFNEGMIVAQLEHPNIVKIYDVGYFEPNTFFMAMEYLSGGNLRERLMTQTFTPTETLTLLKEIGAGLQHAHEQGFLHRDIKPENILFRKNGVAVLTDFGIAKLQDSTSDMTRMGLAAGTVHYMSPEQATSNKLTEHADLYSLGLVVFEMLSGEKVCKADSLVSAIYQHTTLPLPQLPEAYRSFQPILEKALAKLPEARYPSVHAFVDAFAVVVQQLESANAKSNKLPVSKLEPTLVFHPSEAQIVSTQSSIPNRELDTGKTVIFDPSIHQTSQSAHLKCEPDFSGSPKLETSIYSTSQIGNKTGEAFWKQPLFLVSLLGGLVIGGLLYWLLLPKPLALPSLPVAQPSTLASQSEPPLVVTPTELIPSPVINPPPITAKPPSLNSNQSTSSIAPNEPKLRRVKNLTGQRFITTTDLNLRMQGRADATSITVLPKGTQLTVTSDDTYEQFVDARLGRWYKVTFSGKQGYVFNSKLRPVPISVNSTVTTDTNLVEKAYVIHRTNAKLYVAPESAANQSLPLNTVLFLQKLDTKTGFNGEDGQWMFVKTQQNKQGYIFDKDAFPLTRVDIKKKPAQRFRFKPNMDTGTLSFAAKNQREVYVLGASKSQKITLTPEQANDQVRIYIFGDDLSIVANNLASVEGVTLPVTQDYYVTFHWAGQREQAVDSFNFKLLIEW